MSVPTIDFSIFSGDSRNIVVSVTDGNSNVIDLTGATLVWNLLSGNQTVSSKSTTNGGITSATPTSGQFTVELKPGDTSNLAGAFTHECRMTDSAGNSSVIFTGSATITKSNV